MPQSCCFTVLVIFSHTHSHLCRSRCETHVKSAKQGERKWCNGSSMQQVWALTHAGDCWSNTLECMSFDLCDITQAKMKINLLTTCQTCITLSYFCCETQHKKEIGGTIFQAFRSNSTGKKYRALSTLSFIMYCINMKKLFHIDFFS